MPRKQYWFSLIRRLKRKGSSLDDVMKYQTTLSKKVLGQMTFEGVDLKLHKLCLVNQVTSTVGILYITAPAVVVADIWDWTHLSATATVAAVSDFSG
uniref:Uncharacterized protein n=1 Tax=Oryza meridionalis TaxID=40149 RepID=A0A0E0D5L8_9ORYZ